MSAPHIPGANVRLTLMEKGATWSKEAMVAKLMELGVLRRNFFSNDYWVIYTETGPIDIKLTDLTGEN